MRLFTPCTDCTTEQLLRATGTIWLVNRVVAVDMRGVEQRYAEVDGPVDGLDDLLVVERAVCAAQLPATKADRRALEVGFSYGVSLHLDS